MGKRKQNQTNEAQNAKKKRARKFSEPAEEQEDYEEVPEQSEEHEGSADDAVLPELKTSQLPPMKIYEFCKKLLEQNENERIRKGSATLKESEAQLYPGNSADIKQIQQELRRYYREAVQISNVSLNQACKTIIENIAHPEYVTKLPNFPAKPKNSYMIFLSKHHNGQKGLPSKEVTALYNKDVEMKNACDEEACADELRYIDELRQFVNEHKELLPEHSQYLMSKIAKLVKKHEPKKDSPVKKTKKTKAPVLTAFDFFKQSKKNKYTDLEEDAREAKFRKKFDKLDPDLMAVFQELAENQA